jgi:hypothetical protein
MNCPNCKRDNPVASRFCQYCGASMPAPAMPAPVAKRPDAAPMAGDLTGHGSRTITPALGSSTAVSRSAAPGQLSQHGRKQPISQIGGGGVALLNIWGPFAGYGARGRHVSWLLDNLGDKATALHQAVTERFNQRQIPSSRMHWVTLLGKGIIVERRPFYFIQRGITTAALYIGQFGEDLYISQVTYAKGPINNLRVAILGAMIFFHLYFVFGYAGSLERSIGRVNPLSPGGEIGSIFFLLCVIGPVGLINAFLLFLVFLYSAYKWLADRDFLAILRTPPNEFQLDDINALEKAVEETVRQSLDKIGIDMELMPPAPEKSFAARRLI